MLQFLMWGLQRLVDDVGRWCVRLPAYSTLVVLVQEAVAAADIFVAGTVAVPGCSTLVLYHVAAHELCRARVLRQSRSV